MVRQKIHRCKKLFALLCFEEVVMWYVYLEKVKRFDAFVFTCGSLLKVGIKVLGVA